MENKILIAYASRAGSTGEVARVVGEVLQAQGAVVDVAAMKEIQDLSPYRAVVVGSAIRMGSWVPEATAFVKKHSTELGKVPTAYFTVCLTLKDDNEENRKKVDAYLDPLRVIVKPAVSGSFAGVMDPIKLSVLERLMVRMIKAPTGDFRNWDAIRGWAAGLLEYLLPERKND
jgi:menaquinone-dependent protoporphyrinogen oxidase